MAEVPLWKVHVEAHEWQCEPANEAAKQSAEQAQYPQTPMVQTRDLVLWLADPQTRKLVAETMHAHQGESATNHAHAICAALTDCITASTQPRTKERR